MLKRFISMVRSHIPKRQTGQGVVEYALIMVGVSVATEVAIEALGQQVADVFNAVGDALKSS